MSAIALLWNTDSSPIPDSQLAKLADLLRHRGPDGLTVRTMGDHGEVGLVHAKLTTDRTSLADDGLAVDGPSGTVAVSAARIDNRREVDDSLGPTSVVRNDSARLLGWYLAGRRCAPPLGDFAVALWNPRRAEVVAVRDQIGVRPLYYAMVGHTFLVASEIRAFAALPGAFHLRDNEPPDRTIGASRRPTPQSGPLRGATRSAPSTARPPRRRSWPSIDVRAATDE